MNVPLVVTITAGVLFVIGFWSSGVTHSTYGQHHGTYRPPPIDLPSGPDFVTIDDLINTTKRSITFDPHNPTPFDHNNPHNTNVLHAQTIAPPMPHSRNVIPWATPMQWERDAARKLAAEHVPRGDDDPMPCTCDAHIITYWRPIIMRMQATPIEKFEADMQVLMDYINRL